MRIQHKYWCSIRISVPWRSTGQFRDMQIWLLDNVPDHCDYEFVGVDLGNTSNRLFFFSKEKDATMFALRWL